MSASVIHVQSTSLITTLGGHQKGVLIREVSLYPKSHYMYYSGMGLCSGHEKSVVIRELSLYPQSLLPKLTVMHNYPFDAVPSFLTATAHMTIKHVMFYVATGCQQ